jgi:hypothetical protein
VAGVAAEGDDVALRDIARDVEPLIEALQVQVERCVAASVACVRDGGAELRRKAGEVLAIAHRIVFTA